MGTRTPNYDLYIPGQGEEAWDDEVGGNFTTIDAALQALAAIIDGAVYQINNVTYVAANARWNGSAWNRVDTGRPAVRMMLNSTTGILEIATAAAGTNPISWTTIQAVSASGIDMKSKKIYNLATPTAAADAATKAYIDGLIAKVLPYRPETWPTENLDWGDGSATDVFTESKVLENSWTPRDGQWTPYVTPAGPGRKYTFTIRRTGGTSGYNRSVDIKIIVNSVEVFSVTDYSLPDITGSWTHTRWIDPGATVEVQMQYKAMGSYTNCQLVITDTGTVGGPKTFNLSGKWLALGIDMKGLAATVKIHGGEIPYSDYAKYFPIAPTELNIPGNWSPSQVRPVIKRYV